MDPVTAAFTAVTLTLATIQQVEQLIERLQDHKRTLSQAEADRHAARQTADAD